MLTKKLTQSFLTSVALVGALVAFAVTTDGQSEQSKLPRGNWSLSVGVYSGPGHESAPVDVFSVTTDAGRGLSVTEVEILNRSDKDVRALKLHWYLKAEDRLLLEDDTQSIDVHLPAGGKQKLTYQIASFALISKPLLKNGVLSGDYRMEVTAGEVEYADASTWRAPRVR